jgi:hypothetical protein|tara:strand:- start:234 stop:593 length:360 start_codon:yes stop_codon:yes gene_type:complete
VKVRLAENFPVERGDVQSSQLALALLALEASLVVRAFVEHDLFRDVHRLPAGVARGRFDRDEASSHRRLGLRVFRELSALDGGSKGRVVVVNTGEIFSKRISRRKGPLLSKRTSFERRK